MNPSLGRLSLFLAAGLVAPAAAQFPCPPGPPGYVSAPTAASFTTIVGTPTAINLFGANVDDGLSAPLALPGAFAFYGTPRTSIVVDSNGYLSFDPTTFFSSFWNVPVPDSNSPNELVAPWWNDLHTGVNGSVWYAVLPGGDLVVEWNAMERYPGGNGSGESATFQAVLHPSPANTIELRYDGASFASGTDPWDATIGVEDANGTVGTDPTGSGAVNATFPATGFTLAFQTVGPPVSSYVAVPSPSSFVSILGSPGVVPVFGAAVDDETSLPIPLPGPFSFYGAARSSFQVNANGFVAFDQNLGAGYYGNSVIPDPWVPNGFAAPWWEDLHTGAVGSVWFLPVAGGGVIVEWNAVERYPGDASGESATFQLVLHPSPANSVEFRYDAAGFVAGPVGWMATIGVENPAGTAGTDATGLGAANAAVPGSSLLLAACSTCGNVSSFGAGCPSSIGTSGGAPLPGNAGFAITQSGAPPSSGAILLLGLSNTGWNLPPLVPLPLSLAAVGWAGGCSLLVSPEVILLAGPTSPGGASSMGIPIPPGTPSCAEAFAQWLNVVGGVPLVVKTSDGLRIVLG